MHKIPTWYYNSMPPEGRGEVFATSAGLEQKVDAEGSFRFFCGETTTFHLPEWVSEHLISVQNRLYDAAGEMLSVQRLSRESMHMTLHSFWDMGEKLSYMDASYDHREVFRTLDEVRRDFPEEIMMRTVCPLSMVNTSVVMGLAAATEADGKILAEIYSRVSAHYPRSYGLTPHVTLAYYKPGCYPEEVWSRLKQSFEAEEILFPISTSELFFENFTDMSRYRIVY